MHARGSKREAKSAAQIRSPYVVHIYDHGIDNDTPYIVMESLEGEREPDLRYQTAKALAAGFGEACRHGHDDEVPGDKKSWDPRASALSLPRLDGGTQVSPHVVGVRPARDAPTAATPIDSSLTLQRAPQRRRGTLLLGGALAAVLFGGGAAWMVSGSTTLSSDSTGVAPGDARAPARDEPAASAEATTGSPAATPLQHAAAATSRAAPSDAATGARAATGTGAGAATGAPSVSHHASAQPTSVPARPPVASPAPGGTTGEPKKTYDVGY